jgi:acyl-homoserine-lactone acylase
MKNSKVLLTSSAFAILLAGCNVQQDTVNTIVLKGDSASMVDKIAAIAVESPTGKLEADIRRTSNGVPHIVANDWQSLGYGAGYAYSEDNACLVADQIIRIRSQRAKYFGADHINNSGDQANVTSDLALKVLGYQQSAAENFNGLSQPVQALFKGYAKGYNQVVANRAAAWPQGCMAADINIITATDLFAYQLFFAGNGSGAYVLPYVAAAAPPNVKQAVLFESDANVDLLAELSQVTGSSMLGSNAWAIGKERSANGKGALLANPHFPDSGNLRFYEQHLTIPGHLNVTGASVSMFPMVHIGFNQNIAWTHTVSYAPRFTLHQLQLDQKDPTRYMFDGKYLAMNKKTFEIEVKGSATIKQEMYYSKFGPMLSLPGTPLEWSEQTAVAFADVNAFNPNLVQHWLEINLSDNADEFKNTFKRHQGTPWVNTLYSDNKGNAFYIDGSPVPNIPQDVLTEVMSNEMYSAFYKQMGMLLMPGTGSRYLWAAQEQPTIAYDNAPKLQRSDFVLNANGSPWLPTREQIIEGFSPLYGEQKERMSLRTRYNFHLMDEAAGLDKKLNAKEMINAVMGNKVYLAELILADLVKLCFQHGSSNISVSNRQDIKLKSGCDALSQWDGTMNLDSRGGHVFREFAHRFDAGSMFENSFDINDPLNTPNTLVSAGDPLTSVIAALTESIKIIAESGIALDAKLKDIQFVELHDYKGERIYRIAMPGTTHLAGGFNLMEKDLMGLGNGTNFPRSHYPMLSDSGLSKEGYLIQHGTSYLMAVEFTEQGPKAIGLNVFSQSVDAASSFFDDQQRLFAKKQIRPILFDEKDIAKDKQLTRYRVRYPDTVFVQSK